MIELKERSLLAGYTGLSSAHSHSRSLAYNKGVNRALKQRGYLHCLRNVAQPTAARFNNVKKEAPAKRTSGYPEIRG